MTPPPLLKLAFVQGPRDGESLEYKPGSTIRIGRVVRGNEIAIKDAGISTKHLRIVSDSENWIIHDLGSSNGTILNSETLDPDTPVNLRHGDVIKLGELTSIVVSFETDVEAEEKEEEEEEHKLPPRPRRNNRRLPVSDPDPDPVQEKPTRKGRSAKQEEHEPPKRTRVGRPRKNAAPVEKKSQGGEKNTEDVLDLGLDSVKLEVDDTPKGVEISEVKRGTRSRRMRNVKCEDSGLEEMGRPSRATRSTKKKEIGGDSFQELDMVLNQARKSRANKKKVEMEARDEDVEEEEKGRSETSDKEDERVEIESRKSAVVVGEEDLSCSVREDGERENLEEEGGGCDDEEKAKQGSRNEKNVEKVDLEKMTLGDWFEYMKVHLRKQIVDETEKMIEDMRSKSLRVRQHIAEQKQAKGKAV